MYSTLKIIVLLVTISEISCYVVPVASGYIYRSDNHAPASLIQLGPHPIPQPLIGPLPLQTTALEAYDFVAPSPLPYIAAKPIVVEDADEYYDTLPEEYNDGDDLDYVYGYENGEGKQYGEEHHAAHGEKGNKGYHSKGHHAKGNSGNYGSEHLEGHHNENKGEKSVHHDEVDAHSKHHVSGENQKGEDHGHKKYFKKGEDVTGYHKVFHKDEFKKDHDFYDVADNSGNFKKHGYEKKHHGEEGGGHKESGRQNSDFEKEGYGKVGFNAKGHIDKDETSQSAEKGLESHYDNEGGYERDGGKEHKKEYVHVDDEEDEDDDDEYYE